MNKTIRRIDRSLTGGRGLGRCRRAATVVCAVAPIAAALTNVASAGVQLSKVAAGSAQIAQRGSVTTITTGSNNTILYFSKFNIPGGSTVDFAQPSASSRVLDHITSATPSRINGSLLSNGTVYLINPAGVIFGPGAVVNVNRFYAAAAQISDQDFLSGIDHFTNVSGTVSNSGTIRANQVTLIGSQVINQGSIVAQGGVVEMLAGSDVYLTEQGSNIAAKVAPAAPAGSSQVNLAASPLAAGDVYSLAIQHTGTITAANVLINGGQGQVQISGSITASAGNVGGTVAITGGQVNLAGAAINASGPAGGGTVEIGGGPRGGGDLPHASGVSLDASTVVHADATSNGDGGSIVLWSDGLTTTSAILTARGGPLGGNGGYIETSGQSAQINTAPNESAPMGTDGMWLLDPQDIEITNGANNGILTGSATVTNGTIENALLTGNVTLTTDQAGPSAVGNIIQDANATIDVGSTLTSPATLFIEANGTMTLSGGITQNGGSALSVELEILSNATGSITLPASSTISIAGAFQSQGGGFNTATSSSVSAGSIAINTVTTTDDSNAVTPGTVSITGAMTTTGGSFDAGGTAFNTSGQGVITVAGGTVTINSTGAIDLGSAVHTGGGSFSATGTNFENDAVISDDDPATPAANQTVDIITTSSSTGTVDINGVISWTGGAGRSILIQSAGAITITSTGGITATGTIGPLAAEIDDSTTSSADVTLNGPVDITGAFTSQGGDFVMPTGTGSLTALQINIDTSTSAPNGLTVVPGSVNITTPVTTTGENFTADGTDFDTTGRGTISVTTANGNVVIGSDGTVVIALPISTDGGSITVSGNTSFSTITGGTLTSDGGAINLASIGAVLVEDAINTGGGSFRAAGTSFEDDNNSTNQSISDGGTATAGGVVFINTTSGTGSISINGTIEWTAGTGRSVLIQGNGTISLTSTGSIIANTAPTYKVLPVEIDNVSATGLISITGPTTGAIVTEGPFSGQGGNFELTSSGSITASTISINTSTTGANGLAVTPVSTEISGPVTTTAGAFTAGGDSFASDTNGTITTSGGGVSIDVNAEVSIGATVTTNGNDFTATGFDFINTGEITDGGFNDSTGAGVTITATGGNIDVEAPISYATSDTPINFTVPAGQTVILNSNVTATAGEPINFNGASISLPGGSLVSGTEVPTTVTLSCGNLSLTGGILNTSTSTSATPSLVILSGGNVTLGTAGVSGNGIQSITVTGYNATAATPPTTLMGDMFITGDVELDGPVTLAASINVNAGGSEQAVRFDNTLDGDFGLTVSTSNGASDLIIFDGNIGSTTPLASLNLASGPEGGIFFQFGNGSTPPGTQQVATTVNIASGGSVELNYPAGSRSTPTEASTIDSYGDLTVTFAGPNPANQFLMGRNEKITAFGNLTINTNGGTAVIGDLNALDNLTVDASQIVLVLRPPTNLNGTDIDEGVDYVAGGQMSFTPGAIFATEGPGLLDFPAFIAQSFDPASGIPAVANRLGSSTQIIPGLTPAAILGPSNALLDLGPLTISTSFPPLIPPIPFIFDPPIGGAVNPEYLVAASVSRGLKNWLLWAWPGESLQDQTADAGLVMRDPTSDELVAAAVSFATYNDLPQTAQAQSADYSVVTTRLTMGAIVDFLRHYQEVFQLNGPGGPETSNRRAEMASQIQKAWDAYIFKVGGNAASGPGFTRFCAANPSAQPALNDLLQLYSLGMQLGDMGLSRKEVQVVMDRKIFSGLSAEGMLPGDLDAAVFAVEDLPASP